MKSSAFIAMSSVAAILMTTGTAFAADSVTLSALPVQDFAFCLSSDAQVTLSDTSASEVGVVITNVGNALTNKSGKVVVAANNFYGKGAGSEWTSGMGVFNLAGGSCYNVASMNKTTSPGAAPWACASTSGAASGAGATLTGLISTQTQVQPIFNGYVLAGVTSTLNNAPVVNCPY